MWTSDEVHTEGYAEPLGDSSPRDARDPVVQRPLTLAAGSDPTHAGAEPVVSLVLVPSPCHLRQCCWYLSGPFFFRYSSQGTNITNTVQHFPLRSSKPREKPWLKIYFFLTSEKGALPERMNPCRDFTFAIDFMHEMLRYSDSIWQYKKPEREQKG